MPLYEYDCDRCGLFQELRPMRDWDKPQNCPTCECVARKVVSLPRLVQVGTGERHAREVNERSQHEPRCGHKHHHKPSQASGELKSAVGKRPWMIGH